MRILVTGVAGFIGSHLAERLTVRRHEVIGLDNFDPFYDPVVKQANLAGLARLPAARFELVRGDILDRPLLDALLARRPPEVVVHLAALAGVRPSLAEPARYQRVNLEGTATLLDACRAQPGVRRLVFASSSSVYGVRSDPPFREDDPATAPASPYAASKRAAELLLFSYHHLFGFAVTCLRFFTVYGPRQRPEMAIHKFARLIEEGREVPLLGDGQSRRDYTFVEDIVDGTEAAILGCGEAIAGAAGGFRIYNLGGSRPVTLVELVAMLEQALGKPARVVHRPEQPGDVPLTCAEISAAQRDLGYAPRIPLEDGLRRFVDWLRCR